MTDQPSIGALADRIYKHRTKRLALQKRVDALEAEERLLAEQCLLALKSEGLDSARGRVGTITVAGTTQYGVENWDDVLQWIRGHKAWDILHRRVSQEACAARFDVGKEIHGVKVVRVTKLSVSKAGGEEMTRLRECVRTWEAPDEETALFVAEQLAGLLDQIGFTEERSPGASAHVERMTALFNARWPQGAPSSKRFELIHQSHLDCERFSAWAAAATAGLQEIAQSIVDPILLKKVNGETEAELLACADELAMASRVFVDQIEPRLQAFGELLVRMGEECKRLVEDNHTEKES